MSNIIRGALFHEPVSTGEEKANESRQREVFIEET